MPTFLPHSLYLCLVDTLLFLFRFCLCLCLTFD